jgi:two-component system response regulator NreC
MLFEENQSETIRVGLVEDQYLFRKGLKAIFQSWPNLEVVFETGTGYNIIELLNQIDQLPHVLLVDLSLPAFNGMAFGGLEVTKAVKATFPNLKIIILSVHHDPNFISELVLNGAHGYLVKDSDPQEVYDAIVSVYTKGSYINERALAAIQKSTLKSDKAKHYYALNDQLSKREIEVLQLICLQYTTEEIAEKLFISPKTVTGHRNNLLQKTGSRNTAGLVSYAIKNQLTNITI